MSVGSKKKNGFTLIELIVAIAVAAVLATSALPSFFGLINRGKVSSAYNDVLTGIVYARSEAIKRREPVQVVVEEGAGGDGWTVNVNVGGSLLRDFSVRHDEVFVDVVTLEFDAFGRSSSCTVNPCNIGVGDKSINVLLSGLVEEG